jgi:hypothetical protein
MGEHQEQQHLVTGGLMKMYIGQQVRLLLKVENVSPGGKMVNLNYNFIKTSRRLTLTNLI